MRHFLRILSHVGTGVATGKAPVVARRSTRTRLWGLNAISAKRLVCNQQERAILKYIIQLTAGRYNTLGL